MTTLKKSALLVLATSALTVGALAPAAYAQSADGNWRVERVEGGQTRAHRPGNMGGQRFHAGPRMGGGLLPMLLAAPDAEAIEVAAVRLTHQLELTDDQIAALDELTAAALSAQENFTAAREAIEPLDEEEITAEDLTARYAGMVAMTTARAEALETVQPAFEAFVAGLDDAQIALLTPQRPENGRGMHGAGPAAAAPETAPDAE